MTSGKIVAIALVTKSELQGLGAAFNRAWPVIHAPGLNGLLDAIDEADRRFHEQQNANRAHLKPNLD